MSVLVPPRRYDEELMDRGDNDPADFAAALRDIRIVNRRLGGTRSMLRAIDPYLRAGGPDDTVTILDVGTGGGDIPLEMVRYGEACGRTVRVVGLDLDPVSARVAARAAERNERAVSVVRADAFRLPFGGGRFDLVTSSMFLHHFTREDSVRLLRELRRVARRAVIVNDLRRHRLPWAFIAILSRATLRSRMFRHDAPLSVLRGFTAEELHDIGREAGEGRATLTCCWPFRLLLSIPGSKA